MLEAYEPEPLPVHVLYPHNRHLSAKVRAFVDFLVDHVHGGDGAH